MQKRTDFRVLFMLLIVLAIGLVGTLALSVISGRSAVVHATDAAAKASVAATQSVQAQQQSVKTQQLAQAIDSSGKQILLTTCEDQNARNAASIAALRTIVKEDGKTTPASLSSLFHLLLGHRLTAKQHGTLVQYVHTQATESLAQDTYLINALAPKQDCSALVKKYTPHP